MDLAVSSWISAISILERSPYSCSGGRLGGSLEFAYRLAFAK